MKALPSASWFSPCHKKNWGQSRLASSYMGTARGLTASSNLSYWNYLEQYLKTSFLQARRWMLFIPAVFQSVKMKQKRNPRLLTFSGSSGFHLCSRAVQTGLKKKEGGRQESLQFSVHHSSWMYANCFSTTFSKALEREAIERYSPADKLRESSDLLWKKWFEIGSTLVLYTVHLKTWVFHKLHVVRILFFLFLIKRKATFAGFSALKKQNSAQVVLRKKKLCSHLYCIVAGFHSDLQRKTKPIGLQRAKLGPELSHRRSWR